jgi:glucan 1,3-beta-glucosidase
MTEAPREDTVKNPPTAWRLALVAGVILTGAVLLLFRTWQLGRPIDLPNAAHEKLQCASYTPSNNGRMLDLARKRELVSSDLRLLAERFQCVRTYSVSEGLDDVPRVARELGLKVLLGMWISMDAPSNDREIARGIELANEYADVVSGIIVGNEVLLRRELTAAQLRGLLERVKAATKVPVTYADVWEFWLRNAELAKVADFVTIHILPYWEDDPIDIDRALDHVQSIYKKVQAAFPESKVLIGETGWPSIGRPRLDAVPSLTNEARFIREFVAYAERENIPYNLIEAFDQPWKRNQEGTVGGYWGLYDADGNQKFAFTGALVGDSNWRIAALGSLFGVVFFGAIGWFAKPRCSLRALALVAIAGHIAGNVAVKQWFYVSTANRTALEWIATSGWALVGWITVLAVSLSIARWVDGTIPQRPASVESVLFGVGHGSRRLDRAATILGLSRLLMLIGVAYVCLALCYEGRGRDFPIALMALPVAGYAILEFIAPSKATNSIAREESLLAFILVAASAFIVYKETIYNTRAVAWCALCALFAGTIVIGQWRSLHKNQGAEQQPSTA